MTLDATNDVVEAEPVVGSQLIGFVTCRSCGARVPVCVSVTQRIASALALTIVGTVDEHGFTIEPTGNSTIRVDVRHCPNK